MRAGDRATHVAVLAALATAIAVVYGSAIDAPFVLDARAIILQNPALRALTWEHVVTLFTHDYWHPLAVNGLYRPLTQLTYLLDWSVLGHGDRAPGYRLENLMLHWACSALAYDLLLELGAAAVPAALAAALFALHPIATEAVTNVVGRADLLATATVLGGLACHARARRTGGREAVAWHVAVGAIVLLGLFCKESAAVIVPAIVLWDLLVVPPPDRPAIVATVASLGAPLVLWITARSAVLAYEWPAETSALDNPLIAAPFWSARLTAIKVVGRQLATLAWPARLSVDYGFDQIPLVGWPPDATTVLAALAIVAVGATAMACRRRAPAITFLLLLYGVALLPTSNLLAPIGSIMADRFLYLPSVGAWGVLALAASQLAPPWRATAFGGLAVAVVLFGAATIARNRDWRSEEQLWASAVAAAPRSAKAHRGWAAALAERDPHGVALDRAIAEARTAVAIRPDFGGALLDVGGYRLQRGDARDAAGDHAGAQTDWRRALVALAHARHVDRAANRDFHRRMQARGRRHDQTPDAGTAEIYRHLALVHLRLGQPTVALAAFRQASRLDPWSIAARLDVSAANAMLSRWDDAAVATLTALALDERNPDAQARLVELYRRIDPALVVVDAPGRVHVPLDDALVRRHRCRAYRELATSFGRARIPDAAAHWRGFATTACAG